MSIINTVLDKINPFKNFPGFGNFAQSYPGSTVVDIFGNGVEDWDKVAQPHANSIMSIVLSFKTLKFCEAPLIAQRKSGEKGKDWDNVDHPAIDLIGQPNPFYNAAQLWGAIQAGLAFDGNAYLMKVRSASGKVVELWPAPVATMCPYSEVGYNNNMPFAYIYTPLRDGHRFFWRLEDVIHIRYPLNDARDPFRGRSPLASQQVHLATDNELGQYAFTILHNMGVAGAVFMPDVSANGQPFSLSEGGAAAVKREYENATTGRERGRAIVLRDSYKVTFPQVTPDKMAVDKLGAMAENRIPAAFGLNSIALGLTAGQENSTYANLTEAMRSAWDNSIAPDHGIVAEALTRRLLQQEYPNTANMRLWFDYGSVPSLQEDENELSARARENYKAGIYSLADAKRLVRLEPNPGDEDIYVSQGQNVGMGLGDIEPVDLKKPNAAKDANAADAVADAERADPKAPKEARAARAIEFKEVGPESVVPGYDSDIVHDAIARATPEMQQLMLAKPKEGTE